MKLVYALFPFFAFAFFTTGYAVPAKSFIQPRASSTQTLLDKLQAGKTLTVRLKNLHNGQYLYAEADQFNKNDRLRSVYTCRTKRDPKTGNWANWNMTGKFTAYGSFTVQLASVAYNNEVLVNKMGPAYLERPNPPTRRYMYTLIDKTLSPYKQGAIADWYLDAHPDGSFNRYLLRSFFVHDLVYSPSSGSFALDSSRLNVFTWIPEDGVAGFVTDYNRLWWDFEIVAESS